MDFQQRFLIGLSFIIMCIGIITCTTTVPRVEKIFIHERGQNGTKGLDKLGRMEIESPEIATLRRAVEEIKENVPKYTGYFFLDLIFEMFKTAVVFLITLMTPPESATPSVPPELENF